MRFYFPDSQDLVSPTYDFRHDEYSPLRVRQRDDLYAHEVLAKAPYDGILVSKAIVDGSINGAGKYSMPQRERMYRLGVRRFFRLPEGVRTLGDCGAFNYINEPVPPYTVNEVLDFYQLCGFDSGVSVDHVILGYKRPGDVGTPPADWEERRSISLRYAERFLDAVHLRGNPLEPLGAAQGWSPSTYADSVRRLQEMGYQRIALGGMVPLKTPDILNCLRSIDEIREPTTELHLLGVTRIDAMSTFAKHGVTSFDSTSAFRQSFMDDKDNYHTLRENYSAVRVPQTDGNIALKRAILSGIVSQRAAVHAEKECLKRLREFDEGKAETEDVLDVLSEYEKVAQSKNSYVEQYRRTLRAGSWRECPCSLCKRHGIEIMIFRGTERNKRRGFHNLSVLAAKLRALPSRTSA